MQAPWKGCSFLIGRSHSWQSVMINVKLNACWASLRYDACRSSQIQRPCCLGVKLGSETYYCVHQ